MIRPTFCILHEMRYFSKAFVWKCNGNKVNTMHFPQGGNYHDYQGTNSSPLEMDGTFVGFTEF